MSTSEITALVDRAAAPYRHKGRFAWHFARGKLRHDPVFAALLASGLFATPTRIVDLGCGQGLLANWLNAAHTLQAQGAGPTPWPAVARFTHYLGIEISARDVARSVDALPANAQVDCADICQHAFGPAERIVILDVLHYLDRSQQEHVLDRVCRSLTTDGCLLLRVGDASAHWRSRLGRIVDRLMALSRRQRYAHLHCRRRDEWVEALQARQLSVEVLPMSAGTPFANVLLIARHAQGAD